MDYISTTETQSGCPFNMASPREKSTVDLIMGTKELQWHEHMLSKRNSITCFVSNDISSALKLYSFDSRLSNRFVNAVATSSVKSLACKLLPFFANANLEHSLDHQPYACQSHEKLHLL